MKKNTTFRTVDLLILIAILIQFIIFLMNYESSTLMTVTSVVQLGALGAYLYYAVRQRQSFESLTNQEKRFYDHQFEEIKYQLDAKKIKIGKFLNRQKNIESIQHLFDHAKLYYSGAFKIEDDHQLSFDMILVTGQGIFVIDFYDARFILRGDYSEDIVQVQYSEHQSFEILNPLSSVHPLISYLKRLLDVTDEAIKRLMIIEDNSYVGGMDSLKSFQQIAKNKDIKDKVNQLIESSQSQFNLSDIDKFDQLIQEKLMK